MRRARRNHGGQATVEVVLVTPVLLLLVVAVIQFALWYHGVHVAEAAAQEGVRAARVDGGSAAAGQGKAQDFLAQAAPTLVGHPSVTSARDADTARVEVRGTAVSLVPGLHLPIEAVAQSPVERFRPAP